MHPDHGFIPFLQVNDPLPDWIPKRINTNLDHGAQRVQFCQDEASQPRHEADCLDHESKCLQFQRDIYATLRAPIRRVPPEILAHIMHWALTSYGRFVNRGGRVEFLRLRQVAKLWRKTAYSTPSLWRFLSIDIHDDEVLFSVPDIGLATLRRRLDWWFGHAGRNAEVHLDLGINNYPWSEAISCIESIWGATEGQYRLATVQLWGELVLGSDLQEEYPSMGMTKNLTISDCVSDLQRKFPALESFAFSMQRICEFPKQPIHHLQLRSLFLSYLSLRQKSFAPILEGLPLLEELIIDNCHFGSVRSTPPLPPITHPSLRRLVATDSVLSRWQSVTFPSLEFCQIIPNTCESFSLWNPGHSPTTLALTGDFLRKCNAPNLTLDLTRAGLELSEVFCLLSSIPVLHSLFLADPAPIFSDEGRVWRAQPTVKHVVCERYLPIPIAFRPEVLLWGPMDSSSRMVSIYAPNHPVARGSSHFVCSETTGTQRVSMNLICLPGWRITDMLRNEFPIRNHEYEALKEILDA
ncbi:hypothetical protein BKA70DRAFT_1342027 [Coprinopsis sp. MPI-PUGE-AT-0042]|nr:hypothetical protein BKA70DRAFT_1342027 [Coprinopsis sp. MPI-PUGE-AT-0042]